MNNYQKTIEMNRQAKEYGEGKYYYYVSERQQKAIDEFSNYIYRLNLPAEKNNRLVKLAVELHEAARFDARLEGYRWGEEDVLQDVKYDFNEWWEKRYEE